MSPNISMFMFGVFTIWMIVVANVTAESESSSSTKNIDKGEVAKILQILAANRILEDNGYEQYKRAEPYGHLRFGRSDNSNNRFKYADPDYGHMRFGR